MNKTHRRLFTLVELLVVIAIISILAAMLLPALQRARMQGYTASCVSQHKQLGLATQMYGDEYDGVLHPYQAKRGDWVTGTARTWSWVGAEGSGSGGWPALGILAAGYLAKAPEPDTRFVDIPAFLCPGDTTPLESRKWDGNAIPTSYGYNMYASLDRDGSASTQTSTTEWMMPTKHTHGKEGRYPKLASHLKPTLTLIFADTANRTLFSGYAANTNGKNTYRITTPDAYRAPGVDSETNNLRAGGIRHDNRTPMDFVDGHAEVIPTDLVMRTKRDRALWNSNRLTYSTVLGSGF